MKINGTQALAINIANLVGDKYSTFKERLQFVRSHTEPELEELAEGNPLALELVSAFKDAKKGKLVYQPVHLDATSSGIQLMSAISCDHLNGWKVNLSSEDRRSNVYKLLSSSLPNLGEDVVKTLVMTYIYNSRRELFQQLGEVEARRFMKVIASELPGAVSLMAHLNSLWTPTDTHSWTLPDGHQAKVPVTEKVAVQLPGVIYMTEQRGVREPQASLAPNVIHSIDAWVSREVITRAYNEGFAVFHTHDSFFSLPNHLSRVMELYRETVAKLVEINLMDSISKELSNKSYIPYGSKVDTLKLIKESHYMIS